MGVNGLSAAPSSCSIGNFAALYICCQTHIPLSTHAFRSPKVPDPVLSREANPRWAVGVRKRTSCLERLNSPADLPFPVYFGTAPTIIHDGATNLLFGLPITPPSHRIQLSGYNESSQHVPATRHWSRVKDSSLPCPPRLTRFLSLEIVSEIRIAFVLVHRINSGWLDCVGEPRPPMLRVNSDEESFAEED